MIPALAFGLLCGLGVWLIARGLLPQPRPLDDALHAITTPRWEIKPSEGRWAAVAGRLVSRIDRRAGAGRLQADLAVLDRDLARHVLDKLQTAGLLAAVPLGSFALTALVGVALPVGLSVVAAVAAAVTGWFLADMQLRQQAARRRQEFAVGLGCYLDLVTVLMTGGAGHEQALWDACREGRGWSFGLIRRCLTEANIQGISPWRTLAATAERMDLAPLIELAAAVQLTGETGARVRTSLTAKAQSLRSHELARVEAAAAASTEKMAAPVASLVIGFVVLIGYPAFAQILKL